MTLTHYDSYKVILYKGRNGIDYQKSLFTHVASIYANLLEQKKAFA